MKRAVSRKIIEHEAAAAHNRSVVYYTLIRHLRGEWTP